MRIGELSRRSGVPVPTIKYYVREGVLPAGTLTSPNQARYDDGHERRLRLIRALLDVGGLSLSAIAEVLEAVDDPGQPVHKVLGVAARRIIPEESEKPEESDQSGKPGKPGKPGEAEEVEAAEGAEPGSADAREEVAALLARRGWYVDADDAAARSLAGVLEALHRVGHGAFVELLDVYADAAEPVARADLDYVRRRVAREDLVESVVVGTVLGEAMFGALRRLAHVDASARAYGDPEEAGRWAGA
ncbi:Predicted transcriptional regulators [Streptomyces sp. LamerLS-316]|uniref:MerR family transcriptional regulator n=1 Tax=unclassified Streptomyces TaxID=2593676 RepID=UPI000823E8B0|nr:MerR family transcriptional regulator [Streptomyces sp. LamerLS-316]MYQ37287.1 MerR family transcriptional regulator [Streptomyces sp. SID4921]SCK22475.1 Predicted transcriptional regulators [Streptomyces sp. LamerLS-316]